MSFHFQVGFSFVFVCYIFFIFQDSLSFGFHFLELGMF